MIELKNVKKVYKSKKGTTTIALDDVNIKIGNNGMLFIVGKSGSGKSTLLNLLGGLDKLDSGEILINGKNISNFNKKQYDSYRNTYIGFIFQEFNILEQYNVYENIELALKLQNQKTSKTNIDELLNKLGLNNLGNRKINELSGGQKQRVAIARALIKNPKIILADEPTGNLDKNSSEQIFNILKEISKNQLVIVVSHDMESASKYADRIIKLEDGKVIEDTNKIDTIQNDTFELKKSKLPLTYALKMSLTSFKTKPFKLFMTILLTAISLIFMGLTVNCTLFEESSLQANVLKDNKRYFYNVYNTEIGPRGSIRNLVLNDSDFTEIEKITNSKSNKVYDLYDNGILLNFEYGKKEDNNKFFMYEPFASFIEIEDERVVLDVIGRLPKENNELVVHKYLADYVIKYGIIDCNNELYFPKNYEELVNSNKKLKLGTNEVVIVGIVDDDNSLYQEAFNKGQFTSDELEFYYFNNYVENGRYIYVKGFTESVNLRTNKEYILEYMYLTYNDKFVSDLKALNENINIISKNGNKEINSLAKNEVVISIDALKKFDRNFEEKFAEYLALHNDRVYSEVLNDYIYKYVVEDKNLDKLNIDLFNATIENSEEEKVEIIGISLNESNYVSNDYVNEYEPIKKAVYSVRIYDDNINNLKKTFNQIPFKNSASTPGTYYTFDMEHAFDVNNVIVTYKGLAIYILIVSLVFVIFTLLLFSNFISVSISYCKKEIGILRALGATSKDIIKIFSYEAIIIGIISWFISIIGWFILCDLLNQSFFGNLYYTLNGIITHPLVPIGMLVYTLIIAFTTTFISITKITNIKPIDVILNK